MFREREARLAYRANQNMAYVDAYNNKRSHQQVDGAACPASQLLNAKRVKIEFEV